MRVVAIIGRPNVGKSALFNRLAGRTKAIVEDRPGVTRDRIFAPVEWNGRRFWVVDTGGFEPQSKGPIQEAVRAQVRLALAQADLAVLVVDGKQGLHPLDEAAAALLRGFRGRCWLAVNKCDNQAEEDRVFEFAKLGFERVLPLSALHGRGVDALLEELCAGWAPDPPRPEGSPLRLAIVGRPNVGKSSLLNALLGQERQIVSPLPGTTRDAVDTPLRAHGRDLVLVDTAGIRQKASIDDDVERYAVLRSLRAIEECDVALLVLDATQGPAVQDERIAGLVAEAGRACVILVNKWDLQPKQTGTYERCLADLRARLHFLDWAPCLFVSATTRQRLGEVLPLAIRCGEAHAARVPTARLNRVLAEILAEQPLPSRKGKSLKIFYLSQTGTRPPSFALFVNDPKLLHFSTERRLIKALRRRLNLEGTPIILMKRRRA